MKSSCEEATSISIYISVCNSNQNKQEQTQNTRTGLMHNTTRGYINSMVPQPEGPSLYSVLVRGSLECGITNQDFYTGGLLAPHPTPKLENHSLSANHNCLQHEGTAFQNHTHLNCLVASKQIHLSHYVGTK
jgi:hypothetical protein